MRGVVPVLLLPLLLAGCGPTPEQELTKRVLVDAHTARTGVIHLTSRYAEILEPAAGSGEPSRGWEETAAFRASAEGLVARELLSALEKPVAVDPALGRAGDIEGLTVATADLVRLALEPAGSWESWSEEIQRRRSRLDRAIAALEAGTKNHVLIQARTETNRTSAVWAEALVQARAGGAAAGGEATPTP